MGQIIATAISRDIVSSPDAYGKLAGAVGYPHYSVLMNQAQTLDEMDEAIKDIQEQLNGMDVLPSGGGVFYVNITPTGDNTSTSDKTFAEITEAQNNGKIVKCKYAEYILPICWLTNVQAIFGGTTSNVTIFISIDQNNGVQVQTNTLAIEGEVPTKEEFDALKNSVSAIDDTIGAGTPLVASAAVGQTVVVKAVDENGVPTEWEAVDLASGGGTEKAATLLDVTLESPVERVDCPFAEEHQNLTNFLVLVYPVKDGTYTGTSHTINVFLYWADGTNDKATITANLNQTANTSAYACNIYYNPELNLYRYGNNVFCERRGVAGSKMIQISLAAAFTEKEFKAGTRIVIKGWRDNL